MSFGNHQANRSRRHSLVTGPRAVSADRRNRRRFRELCDEVLASYRIATGEDLFSDSDRAAPRAITSAVAPIRVSTAV
jgi:hypothetical protein